MAISMLDTLMTRTFRVVTLHYKECLLNISDARTLFTRLAIGFVIYVEKSCFIPAQQMNFLGFVLDSVSMTIALTEDKKG